MVVKINSKPIEVREEDAKERDFDPVYFGVSCVGYLAALWVLDYVCGIFFFIHPFPVFHMLGGWFHWIATLL